MSYEMMFNDYGHFVLFRTRDFFIIDSSTKKGPLDALRKDIMHRVERGKHAVPVLPHPPQKGKASDSNVEMPPLRP